MIKKILTLVPGVLVISIIILSIGSSEKLQATTRIVEYGASWNFGSYMAWNGKHAYSNVMSTTRTHASTAEISGKSVSSGYVPGGIQSRADVAGYVWDTTYAYYNIW